MKPTYTKTTRHLPAVPRSKRRSGEASASGSTIVSVGGGSSASTPAGHIHDNLPALNRIADVDNNGNMFITLRDEDGSPVRDDQNDNVTVKVGAGTADVALLAEDVDPTAPGLANNYLSKTHTDSAAARIAFEDGIEVGDFLAGARGGRIDAQGNAELESLEIRSALRVKELVVNRQSILDGDQILAPGDTIVGALWIGRREYRLFLREKYDGYHTAFAVGDVVRGVIMHLPGGGYYTSWMEVLAVESNTSIIVRTYADAETPAGHNYAPAELMVIARWGHISDPSRQTCFYLSSTEGRIVRVKGVNSPFLSEENYAAIIGQMPEGFLAERHLPTLPGLDYTYTRGLIVQDIIRTDYAGNPIPLEGSRPNLLDGTASPSENLMAAGDGAAITVRSDGRDRWAQVICHSAPHTADWEWISYPVDVDRLKPDTDYTLSFDIESDTPVSFSAFVGTNDASALATNRPVTPVISEGRCLITLHTLSEIPTFAGTRGVYLLISQGRGQWSEIHIGNIKIEEGSTSTEWTESDTDKRRSQRGATMRGPRQWLADESYQSDADGGRYIDVVIHEGNYYYCKRSHVSPHTPGTSDGDAYWQLGDAVGLVATDLLLSHYAKIGNLGVEHVETSAGSTRIEIDGGEIRAYGTRNSSQPNIRFGIDETGAAVIQFFDNNGTFLYDLGPNGIRTSDARPERWEEFPLYPAANFSEGQAASTAWRNQTGTTYSKYHSAINVGVVVDPEHDGLVFTDHRYVEVSRNTLIADGWYIGCGANNKVAVYTIKTAVSHEGQTSTTRSYCLLYCYTNGRCVGNIKAYFD